VPFERGDLVHAHVYVSVEAGMAAPLHGLPRFHVIDDRGHPACVPVDHCPIYGTNTYQAISRRFVPDDLRCHRWGCGSMWPPFEESGL
jgi:hypothetical protein